MWVFFKSLFIKFLRSFYTSKILFSLRSEPVRGLRCLTNNSAVREISQVLVLLHVCAPRLIYYLLGITIYLNEGFRLTLPRPNCRHK